MPMTEKQLLQALDNEEPRYPDIAAQLDASDVPKLKKIAEGDDMARATKAVYLASLVDAGDAQEIVVKAASSPAELVRIASATALENLPPAARERAAAPLIDADNPAVAKLVLRAVDASSPALAPKIRAMRDSATNPEIRDLARSKLENN